MLTVRTCSDPRWCQRLWETLWPQESLFDLWPVRACFSRHFPNPPAFLVAEEGGHAAGFLALSWIPEIQAYAHFPGETWKGKTWLEQNRIPASHPSVVTALLEHLPEPLSLRYLLSGTLPGARVVLDETGYLFFPRSYDDTFEAYWAGFSGKVRKHWEGELRRLEAQGVTYRHDGFADLETLFELNRQSFGPESYFQDPRFLRAFEDMASWLRAHAMARLTTVLVGGRVAAVDFGGIFQGHHTVLAGGTAPEFPGVAKLMNLHHIRQACRERLRSVDFLCGDFGWKERFHLTPRPLFKMELPGISRDIVAEAV